MCNVFLSLANSLAGLEEVHVSTMFMLSMFISSFEDIYFMYPLLVLRNLDTDTPGKRHDIDGFTLIHAVAYQCTYYVYSVFF